MLTKATAPVLEIKEIEESGKFSGYGSIFGNIDSYRDVVEAGAFAKSLAEHRRKGSRVRMFWGHDPDQPIGKWIDMAEDGKGLFVEGQLNMGVQRAREAYSLLKEGDIDGLSIGYRVVASEPDAEKNVLRLKELQLVEVSVVSLAANDRARVDSVKAAELDGLRVKLLAGDRLTEREWELVLKAEPFGLSNSQAERAVRVNLKRGQGEPDDTAEPAIKAALPDLRAALDGFLSRS